MRTLLILQVDHDKPIPENAGELLSNRAYTLLLSAGVKVDVDVVQLPVLEVANER